MIHKIIQTGLVLSVLLMVPGVMKGAAEPPDWVKALILVPGSAGLAMVFVGTLALIWI